MDISRLVWKIKEKKELRGINDELIKKEILEFLRKNPKLAEVSGERSANFRRIVKNVRLELHKSYGIFQTKGKKEIYDYLAQLDIKKILSLNLSTRERIGIYPELYKKIFEITGKPDSIMDLGCGFNPFSFSFMKLDSAKYHAFDINEEDIKLLNDYFKLIGMKGEAEIFNIKSGNFEMLPSVDACFLFKVLESIESKGHKLSEKLIKALKCRWIIASFSLKTISGRKMIYPQRQWFEVMLSRIGLEYKILRFENEIFYVIKKKK
jgi:hypothetical protein